MGTFVHGVGASENIDSSGERLIIAGMDISSLPVDGVLNFEHDSKSPASIVGKILQAKKIFSEKDCENEPQLYFWNKVKVPYLYVMGELFDDYKESARDIAGMFRYDADKKNENERAVMNFSVEGAKLNKVGIDVTHSIARKITITVLPCNKSAVAEMVQVKEKPKNDMDSLFKTEYIEIELFKSSDSMGGMPNASGLALKEKSKNTLKKDGPSSAGGLMMGSEEMKKAKPNLSLVPNLRPKPRTSEEHGKEADFHSGRAKDTKLSLRDRTNAAEKAGWHRKMAGKKGLTEQDTKLKTNAAKMTPATKETSTPISPLPNMPHTQKLHHPERSGTMKPPGPIKKALTAGSGLCAPDQLVGGAALGRQGLQKAKDPGTVAINRPLKSKDSRENTLKNATVVDARPPTSIGMQKPPTPATNTYSTAVQGGGHAMAKASRNPALEPKETKIKQLQSKIDTGTYKPDASKIADKMVNHKEKPLQKSKWLARAEEEYANWDKKDQFEAFMKSRMPHLTKGEIQAIGQTMALGKSMKMEKALSKIVKK